MKRKIVVVVVLLVVSLLAVSCREPVASQAAPATGGADPATVNVNGIGEVILEPDLAYVTLGVRSESEEAGDAISDNNKLSEAVMAALKANGVEAKDIATSSFNVYWNEIWKGEMQPYQKVYVVENMVTVTVRNIESLSSLLDGALEAGANTVHSVQFDVQDKSEAWTEARVLAVTDAQQQAAQLSAAAGVTLGNLITISSWSTPSVIQPMYAAGMGGAGGSGLGGGASVPVSGGQLVIQVQVNMVYEIIP